MNGIHKLVMSALFALTINPESCILSYPYLTALGKTTDKLHKLLKWDDKLLRERELQFFFSISYSFST